MSNSEEGGWNCIDLGVVAMMVFGALPPPIGVDVGGWKCVRIVRVVRPLQKRNDTVRSLFAALMSSASSIFHVINLLLLLILIFGLMGVNLFRGRFNFCNDESILKGYEECIGTNFGGRPDVPCAVNPYICEQNIGTFLGQEILVPRVWSVRRDNFDNLYAAALTLLRLSSQDNLRPIFHAVMDIPPNFQYLCPGSHMDATNGCPDGSRGFFNAAQPRLNEMAENVVFPITYVFIANIFISQLVIGVLIDNIRRQTGSALFTEEQRIWRSTCITMNRLQKKPKPDTPKNEYRKAVYNFLESQEYEWFIMGVIILNTLWMATEHEPHTQLYADIAFVVGWFFIVIYVGETFAKLFAYGVIEWKEDEDKTKLENTLKEDREVFSCIELLGEGILPGKLGDLQIWWKTQKITSPYFRDPWNSFDFTVVAFSVLDTLGLISFPVLKLLRVFRVLRLVRRIPTLQMMLVTLIGAVPAILSALLFLGIFLFIWAAVGSDVSMFHHLKHGSVINRTWNFGSLINAMLLLFRTTTGDG